MQLARQARALVLLRPHHLLGHQAQLGVGLPVVADVQRQPTGRHKQDRHHGNARHPGEHAADVGLRGGIDTHQRLLHVIQIDAGAQHPAPAVQHDHIAQLLHGLVRGRLFPQVMHHFALLPALARGRQQVLDDGLPARVAQVPEVLPHQLGLARVHQVLALQVVDEEIAIVAELHLRQQFQRFLARGFVVARGLQRRHGAVGQADIVAQLAFLAGQPGASGRATCSRSCSSPSPAARCRAFMR